MTVLFVHGHRFRRSGGLHYSTGGLDNATLSRYADVFGNLRVLARHSDTIGTTVRMSPITDPRVSIQTHVRLSKKLVHNEVAAAEAVVCRLPGVEGLLAAESAHQLGKPYLVEVVGCAWDSLWNHSWRGRIGAPYMYFRTRRAVRLAPRCTYVTERFLQRRYPTRGLILACSDANLTPPSAETLRARLDRIEAFSAHGRIVISTIGALDVRYKGQESVVRALKRLEQAGREATYVLIGAGDPSRILATAKRLNVQHRIVIYGTVAHDQIDSLLDGTDVYIQPSKAEGLPRSILEAMNRGCVVMGSSVGGIPEIVDGPYLHRPGACLDIVEKLIQLDTAEYRQQSRRSFVVSARYYGDVLDGLWRDFYFSFITDARRFRGVSHS